MILTDNLTKIKQQFTIAVKSYSAKSIDGTCYEYTTENCVGDRVCNKGKGHGMCEGLSGALLDSFSANFSINKVIC